MLVSPLTSIKPYQGRRGITLTEILISIMIMGIGMVSLATLFPLGLLRLREASRMSRSVYLAESAAADLAARGLLNPRSFIYADSLNDFDGVYWYDSASFVKANVFDPFIQDTPSYGGDPFDAIPPAATTYYGARGLNGVGLPVAYDPLWRWQTQMAGSDPGVHLDPINKMTPESRFASGIGFIRSDPAGGLPSAHGLQRLTNFNRKSGYVGATQVPFQAGASIVPSICVSPEDMVWQDPNAKALYPMAGMLGLTDPLSGTFVDATPSPLVPDLSQAADANGPLPLFDWRYTWMFTGRKVSTGTSAGVSFDGEIVIMENRPFTLDDVSTQAPFAAQMTSTLAPSGEQVVEAVFGYSGRGVLVGQELSSGNDVYNGIGANRSVLLRWPATLPDPEVKVGSWIADVTYERSASLSDSRFLMTPGADSVYAPSTNGQRCYWYQVVKINPAAPATDGFGPAATSYRSMVVQVATPLRAMTPLDASAVPLHVNAALVSPHVVQVIPRSFTVN